MDIIARNDDVHVCRSHTSLDGCHNHQQNIFTSVLKRVAENRDTDGLCLFNSDIASVVY